MIVYDPRTIVAQGSLPSIKKNIMQIKASEKANRTLNPIRAIVDKVLSGKNEWESVEVTLTEVARDAGAGRRLEPESSIIVHE